MTTTEPATARFAEEVRRAIENQPYQIVDETDEGFAMHIDIVDARWYSLYRRNGLEQTWRWQVKVSGDSYSVQDRSNTLDWEAGADGNMVPSLKLAAGGSRGTFVRISTRKTVALNDEGKPDAVVDYSFDSREGKKIITDVADRLGLKRRMDGATKVGLVVAIVAVGGALVAVGVLLGLGLIGR